jgi:hypothetical protein
MDVAIACLSFIMKQKGLESNLSISIVMILLASLSLIFLFWDLTNTKLYPSNQPGRTYKS